MVLWAKFVVHGAEPQVLVALPLTPMRGTLRLRAGTVKVWPTPLLPVLES